MALCWVTIQVRPLVSMSKKTKATRLSSAAKDAGFMMDIESGLLLCATYFLGSPGFLFGPCDVLFVIYYYHNDRRGGSSELPSSPLVNSPLYWFGAKASNIRIRTNGCDIGVVRGLVDAALS